MGSLRAENRHDLDPWNLSDHAGAVMRRKECPRLFIRWLLMAAQLFSHLFYAPLSLFCFGKQRPVYFTCVDSKKKNVRAEKGRTFFSLKIKWRAHFFFRIDCDDLAAFPSKIHSQDERFPVC